MRKIAFLVVLLFLVISLIRNVFDYQRNLSFYDQTKTNFDKAILENKELKIHKQEDASPFEVKRLLLVAPGICLHFERIALEGVAAIAEGAVIFTLVDVPHHPVEFVPDATKGCVNQIGDGMLLEGLTEYHLA